MVENLRRLSVKYITQKFLDLTIKIKYKKFTLGIYDKCDSFPFPIVRMSWLSSNTPSKMFYTSFWAGSFRIGRDSLLIQIFLNHHVKLLFWEWLLREPKFKSIEQSLREKCPNTEFSLVRVFLYSDWIRRFTP